MYIPNCIVLDIFHREQLLPTLTMRHLLEGDFAVVRATTPFSVVLETTFMWFIIILI